MTAADPVPVPPRALAQSADRAMARLRQYPRESVGPAARLLLAADDARQENVCECHGHEFDTATERRAHESAVTKGHDDVDPCDPVPVPQPPGDEVVRARCGCGWESEPVPINADVPNGEWFACRDAATEYRSHFDDKHRPLPQFVTEYVAAAPGVSQ